MMMNSPRYPALLLLLSCAICISTAHETNNLRGGEEDDVAPLSSPWYEWSKNRMLPEAYGTPGGLDFPNPKVSEEEMEDLGVTTPSEATDPNEADIEIVDTISEEEIEEEVMDEAAEEKGETSPSEIPGGIPGGLSSGNAAAASATAENSSSSKGNRRKFVKYESSRWEAGWLSAIEGLVRSTTICSSLINGKHQTANTHAFLNMICMSKVGDWCYYHDHNHFMWYNTKNTHEFQVYFDKVPMAIEGYDAPELKPFMVNPGKYEQIASKFTFLDETTGEEYVEYIEPLVAQLRFPLTECLPKRKMTELADFASYVLPPPNFDRVDGRTILYDVGSKDWSRMEYVVEEWAAHGTDFEYMISYATTSNEVSDDFLRTIPEEHKEKIFRHYLPLVDHEVDDESRDGLFLPSKIGQMTRDEDYILLKLDRGDGRMKQNYVQYIIENPEKVHVDELIWEINAEGNYVMRHYFDTHLEFDEISSLSLPEAYHMLLELRQLGIRSHSWI